MTCMGLQNLGELGILTTPNDTGVSKEMVAICYQSEGEKLLLAWYYTLNP
jgi:hypothetical protein